MILSFTFFMLFYNFYYFRLPLPWILWTAVNQDALGVSSKGAACSISMLFIMLILVFLAILSFKWKMTKAMGAIMLCLYVVFVVISLGFSFGWYTCPNLGGNWFPNTRKIRIKTSFWIEWFFKTEANDDQWKSMKTCWILLKSELIRCTFQSFIF